VTVPGIGCALWACSLARCERAVARVVDVVCGAGPVVILAHGAAR
jgi:hypothetical protein